eukprot:jgi/Mesen1/2157/ME000152S01249
MAEDTVTTLKQALQALHYHPDASVRTAASKWLEEFQQQVEAWQVTDKLLYEPSSSLDVQYFCAQTLRTKLCLAIAALAAHAESARWGEGGGIIKWLARQLGSQQDAVEGLIELLAVLPQ